MHKILILLLYYDRPVMVRNALRSVLKADQFYHNWHLAFVDDSSPRSGEEIVEMLSDRYSYHNTNTSVEDKKRHGSLVGRTLNVIIDESDADLVIMLCDDDELHPQYLAGLDNFFTQNQEQACYSHVHVYNPLFEDSEHVENLEDQLNCFTERIDPYCKLDASQVAWRRTLNVQFAWPRTKCLDADLYKQIGNLIPEGIPFSGLISQYKGIHPTQLYYHNEIELWGGRSIDVPDGHRMIPVEYIHKLVHKYELKGNRSEAIRICKLGLDLHPDDVLLNEMIAHFQLS